MLRIGLHQAEPGSGLSLEDIQFYRQAGIRLLALPEYFWIRPEDKTHLQAASHTADDLEFLKSLSQRESWIIAGGTMVQRLGGETWHNAASLIWRGEEVGRYAKRRLMPGETASGALPGKEWGAWDVADVRIALIVCADVLISDTYQHVARLEPDLVVAPMASPYLTEDTEEAKEARDQRLFVQGAHILNGTVVKVAGTGSLFGRSLQGRCLVAGPEGIIFRTPFNQERHSHRWVVDVPVG